METKLTEAYLKPGQTLHVFEYLIHTQQKDHDNKCILCHSLETILARVLR